MKSEKKIGLDIINYMALPIIIFALWWYVTTAGKVPTLVLPSPQSIGESVLKQLQSGQLLTDIWQSIKCVMEGYLVGAALGIIFGAMMGIFDRVNKFFCVIFDCIRQIPGIAYFPLIILWFGIGNLSKIVLVASGTFFPVLMNTIDGVRNTNNRYLDLVKLYKVQTKDVLLKIYFPSALPFVCTGLKLGASVAWSSVVAAEMLGSSSGLGYRIANSQQLMQSSVMIADIFVIGILGWIVNYTLQKGIDSMIKWKNE